MEYRGFWIEDAEYGVDLYDSLCEWEAPHPFKVFRADDVDVARDKAVRWIESALY
jgi:hypothetical protein